jgi:hypothetical protein
MLIATSLSMSPIRRDRDKVSPQAGRGPSGELRSTPCITGGPVSAPTCFRPCIMRRNFFSAYAQVGIVCQASVR